MPEVGLEPTSLAAPDFESGAFTNFATQALRLVYRPLVAKGKAKLDFLLRGVTGLPALSKSLYPQAIMMKLVNFLLGDGRRAAFELALGSAVLLATAYFFQYVLHILPCELCYWQRKPHFILIGLGLVTALVAKPAPRRALLWLMALVALSNSGIAGFHVGVEQKWWEGLPSCSAPTAVTATIEQARELIFNSTVVRCDQPGWIFLGVSMAGWNGIVSLVMAGWAILAARRSRA